MPSKLDPHVAMIENWLAAEPQLTALAIVGRLSEKHPEQFGTKQHSIVQRLLKAHRKKAVEKLIAQEPPHAGHDRHPTARGCGRLGLWMARPAHSPCRRASLESREAQPISRCRIVSIGCAIRVTFADEAIRWVNFGRRLTVDFVDDDVGESAYGPFVRAGDDTNVPDIRELAKTVGLREDAADDVRGSAGTAALDVEPDGFYVGERFKREAHLHRRDLLRTAATSSSLASRVEPSWRARRMRRTSAIWCGRRLYWRSSLEM